MIPKVWYQAGQGTRFEKQHAGGSVVLAVLLGHERNCLLEASCGSLLNIQVLTLSMAIPGRSEWAFLSFFMLKWSSPGSKLHLQAVVYVICWFILLASRQ